MSSTNCPSREELSRFAVGNLDARIFPGIAAHVEHCRACEATLQALDAAADPLITACASRSQRTAKPFRRN